MFWTQPSWVVAVQSKSDLSVPVQERPLIQMGPVPEPNAPAVRDSVTIDYINTCIKTNPKTKIYCLTCCSSRISSLIACHSCILKTPSNVTYGAPLVLVTDLHTPFIVTSTSHQPNVSLRASCTSIHLVIPHIIVTGLHYFQVLV